MTVYGYDSDRSRRPRGLLARLWNAITWPFRTIERIETNFVNWAIEKRRGFRRKYRHSRVIAPLVDSLVGLLLWPLRLVWWAVSFPFRLIGGAADRVQTVRRRRELLHLFQGLPAAVAAVAAFVVLMKLALQADDLPHDYLRAAQAAYNDEQYELSQVYLQRILQLDDATDEASYLLARSLEQSGQPRRAMAIFDGLAPDDRPGDPRAHHRKAEILFDELLTLINDDDPQTNPTDEQVEVLQQHLQHAASGTFSAEQEATMAYFRGFIYFHMGDQTEGLKYLERASRVRKDLNFDLANVYQQLQEPEKAQQKRELARDYLEDQLEMDAGDNRSRLQLASLFVDEGDLDASDRLLRAGLEITPDERIRQALAIVCIRRYLSLPPDTGATVRMALLERALELDPHCKPAFEHLKRFGGDQSEAAKELLEQMIAVGASAPLAHFALGMRAWDDQQTETALWHLDRAYHLDPALARIGNNFAWLLAHDQNTPDPERALQVINAVLASVPESDPDRLAFVETRGQIHVLLQQWNAALDDLELALQKYNTNIPLHESLALVYDNLGQSGLATKHRNVVTNLKRRLQQSQPDRS